MKRVIKHPKKMKNAMYIVFGVFALALFAITRIHPSYASEGLMIDDALDAIVLYGEVEQLPEDDEEVEEVQDEEVQEIEGDEETVDLEGISSEETTDEKTKEDEVSEDLDETVLEKEEINLGKDKNDNQKETDENNEEPQYENTNNNNIINESQEENKEENKEEINEEMNEEMNEEVKNNEDEENEWEGAYKNFEIDKEENDKQIMLVKTAKLLTGSNFNVTIKSIAGNNNVNNNTYFEDNKVKKIKKYTGNSIPNTKTEISNNDSEYPIYAWFDSSEETLYYYTEADKIYFNEDSSTMFRNFKSLNEINFHEFDLSKVTNMEAIFYGFGLKNIDLSHMDLSKVTNTNYMFQSNNKVENINFEGIDMSSLTNRGYNSMFYSIQSLKSVNLSGAHFDSLISTNQMFYYCDNLKDINLAYSNFGNVETANYMFYSDSLENVNLSHSNFGKLSSLDAIYGKNIDLSYAILSGITTAPSLSSNLETINLEGTDLRNLKTMRYRFQSKDKLKSINFSGTILNSLENMSYMFQSNKSIKYVDFSNTDLSSVTTMEEMFGSANGITGVNFSGCNLSNVKNTHYMFNSNKNLENVNFYGADLRSLENVQYMFQGSYDQASLGYINFEKATLGKTMEEMFEGIRKDNNTIINFSGADFSNVENMKKAFWWNQGIQKIDFSNLKGANNIKTMELAFYDNELLTGIDLSSFDFGETEDMRNMFESCKNIKNIKLGTGKFENETNLSYMFKDCKSLESIDLSSLDLGKVTDMTYMFQECNTIRNIKFGKGKFGNGTNMSHMFENCYSLNSLDLSGLDLGNVTDMSYMFSQNRTLKNINFGENIIDNVENMQGTFYNCSSLTSLDLSNFKTNNVTNMSYMLYGDGPLEYVYVTEGYFNTENVTNSENMFSMGMLLKWRNIYDKTLARIPDEENDGVFTNILDKLYTITYYTNEGILSGEKTTYTQRDSFTLPVPIRTGYIFLGWTGSNGLEPEITVNIAEFTVGDLEYTANWGIGKYKIIFDTDGGNEINPIEKDYNSLLSGMSLPSPTKECNEFSGWDIELPEIMPAHDITLKAIWNYTCSRSSGGGGGAKKSESTTREIAIDTLTEQEHNSANEEQKSETSETSNTPTNGETTHQVISVTQEISEDGTPIEVVVETVKIKNTDIVATVRTEVSTASSSSSSSSSTTHTKEQNDAYSFAKSNGITTTSSIEDAKMNTELTRIQMAKMLSNFAINVLGQEPDPEKGIVKFNDVTNKMDKQYDNAVTKAYQLGIMGQNMKNNEFRPSDTVTRAEFASALSRLLYQTEEGEYKGTGKYYIPHVSKLYNEGIVNKTDPEIKEKRGYVMTMLMRTVE